MRFHENDDKNSRLSHAHFCPPIDQPRGLHQTKMKWIWWIADEVYDVVTTMDSNVFCHFDLSVWHLNSLVLAIWWRKWSFIWFQVVVKVVLSVIFTRTVWIYNSMWIILKNCHHLDDCIFCSFHKIHCRPNGALWDVEFQIGLWLRRLSGPISHSRWFKCDSVFYVVVASFTRSSFQANNRGVMMIVAARNFV